MTKCNDGVGEREHLSPRRRPHRLGDEEYRRKGVPVFFTLCTAHRRAFLLEPGIPDLIVEALEWSSAPRATCVICYCIMPDHVHVIACNTRKGEDVRDFAAAVKKRCWFLLRDAGIEPPFWQRGYWDEHAETLAGFEEQVDYVLSNPRRAGLCRRDEDWPYLEYRGFYVPDSDGRLPVTRREPECDVDE